MMRKKRKLLTAIGAARGAWNGFQSFGPPGAIIGGIGGGVAANIGCRVQERKAQCDHEQKIFQHFAENSKVGLGDEDVCTFA